MDISVTPYPNGVAVLRLTGGLNLLSAPQVKQRMAEVVAQGSHRLVIDLSDVPNADSTGLGALISGLKLTRQHNGDLRLANVGQQFRVILELSALETVLRRYGTIADAVASFT